MEHGKRRILFARCAPGLEPFLLREARALRLARVEGRPGGVAFTGTIDDVWRANLHFRTASRVLVQVARFACPDAGALYRGARGVDWSAFLRPRGSLRVYARCRRSALDHEVFVAQRVKDAVVDVFRDRRGVRPEVDLEDPDLRIDALITRDTCTLSVDSTGDSLHLRGWRRHQGVAPLKETVAAGILMASGWDLRSPLLDPFCGSGTVLVEAAMMAAGIPAGRLRESFAFERWLSHDDRRWRAVAEKTRGEGRGTGKVILRGWDADPEAVEGARENLRAAGLADRISIETGDARDLHPRRGWNAWVVTNPPYGERLGKTRRLAAVYRRFGEVLRERCAGFTAAILTGNPELAKCLGLEAARIFPVKNGGLDCRLLVAEIGGGVTA